jgi:hypothetical protein
MRFTGGLKGQELLDSWTIAQARGLTQVEHAAELNLTWAAYKSRMFRITETIRRGGESIDRPDLFDFSLGTRWHKQWDNFTVIGDLQLPTTDYDFAVLPALVARKYHQRPRNLIIAGDMFNMDAFSQYPAIVKLPDWKHEKEAARAILHLYLEVFDDIWFLSGNHEYRRLKALQGEDDIQDIIQSVLPTPRIKATVFDRMTVETTTTGTWTVCHGGSYSRNQLVTGDTLAQKFQTHVISHHEHHLAQGWDKYKRYMIINNGGLFDQNKMAYTQLASTNNPNMANGFSCFVGGYPYVLGREPYTNGRFVLGE